MNGLTNTLIGAATADVAAHGIVDVCVGWGGFLGEQCGSRHDLSGLAVATLRNVFFHPGHLHRMQMVLVGRKAFDSGDFLAAYTGDRRDTRARGLAVDVHSTRPA